MPKGDEKVNNENKEWIHFIGIGGAGMSAIAQLVIELGFRVSGSDLAISPATKRLKSLGASIFVGHSGLNINPDIDTVVVSTAVPEDNPEVVEANKMGIKIIHRAEMLARLMQRQKSIAVAGAHGKTTTTSMVSLMLENNYLDPTVVVGGELNDIGGNAKLGKGDYLVAEADESDGSFLKLSPIISIVTNIEDDHLDHYGSIEKIIESFQEFINKNSHKGFAVLCTDDPVIVSLIPHIKKKVISYGLNSTADYTAENIRFKGVTSLADVYYKGSKLGTMELSVPGKHNVSNALAAVAIGKEIGLGFPEIASGLKTFKGVQRRFQLIGEIDDVQIIDDYAHHPTEIKATLAAAKNADFKRIIVVFQPHRYSRTKQLYQEFAMAFESADEIFLTEIYPAGEKPIEGVSTQLIFDKIVTKDKVVEYIKDKGEIVDYLSTRVQSGDAVLTMGAGDVWKIGPDLFERLQGLKSVASK